jgi:hypothetical protein
MSRRRRLPLVHPLAEVFFAAIESVTTSMSGSTKGRYRTTMEYFLRFLGKHHPRARTLEQLRRDPHILGWLKWLSSQKPPLTTNRLTPRSHVTTTRHFQKQTVDANIGVMKLSASTGAVVGSSCIELCCRSW